MSSLWFEQGECHLTHFHDLSTGDRQCPERQLAAAGFEFDDAQPQRLEILHVRFAFARNAIVFGTERRGIVGLGDRGLQAAVIEA